MLIELESKRRERVIFSQVLWTNAKGVFMSTKKGLPSNKKFGIFWCIVLFICCCWSWSTGSEVLSLVLLSFSITFIVLAFSKPAILLPLNIIWMRFGLLLGKLISPIVMLVFFLVIFCPLGILFRILRRDELGILKNDTLSSWKDCAEVTISKESFRTQF